jgi:hypothetical protein
LTSGADALFVQSMSTTLWRINITGTYPNITLQPHWACFYSYTGSCGHGLRDTRRWHCCACTHTPAQLCDPPCLCVDAGPQCNTYAPNPNSSVAAAPLESPRKLSAKERADVLAAVKDDPISLPFSTPAFSPMEDAVSGAVREGPALVGTVADVCRRRRRPISPTPVCPHRVPRTDRYCRSRSRRSHWGLGRLLSPISWLATWCTGSMAP